MSDDNVNSGGKFDEALSCRGANNKASRERQRRIRLNDSFAELAKVLDPGKTPKTDKATIVSDAIRVVTQLRTENGQLHQLNKFLEERVSTTEKQRSEMMMRQAMYQNLTGQQPFMAPQMMMGPGVVMGQPVQGVPMQPGFVATGTVQPGQQMQAMQAAQQQACSSTQKDTEPKTESQPVEAGPSSNAFPQAPASNAMGQLSALLASDHGIFDWAIADTASGVPDDHSWLPALDGGMTLDMSHEDSLRRPPAA